MEQNRAQRPVGPPPHQPAPHHQAPPPRPYAPPKKPNKVPFVIGIIAIVAIAITITGAGVMSLISSLNASSNIHSSKYQAVFLANNMVYFGQISDVNERYITLKDIFYLQVQGQQTATDKSQSSTQANPQFSLTKLGSELHGPDDAMYINRDQVLFWENLKDGSKVTSAIQDYKSKNKK